MNMNMANKTEQFYEVMLKTARGIIDREYPNLTDSEKLPHVIRLMDLVIAVEARKGDSMRADAATGILQKLAGKI